MAEAEKLMADELGAKKISEEENEESPSDQAGAPWERPAPEVPAKPWENTAPKVSLF